MSHKGMRRGKGRVDWILLLVIVFLLVFSIAVVYSASASFAEKKFGFSEALYWNHALRVLLAFVVLLVTSRIDYHLFLRISRWIFFAAVLALAFVLIAGVQIKGAARWLAIGPVRFQPSEFGKFALILYLATQLVRKQSYIHDFRNALLPLLFGIGLIVLPVVLQPDISTALLIGLLGLFLLWIGNVPFWQLSGIAVLFTAFAALFAVLAPYRLLRVKQFFAALQTGEYTVYQVKQALIAFANGGLWGVGPGQSVQRELFLPESYGDFVFAIIGEEYGFWGCGLLLLFYGVILWRGMKIARNAPDFAGYLVASGITFAIVLYAAVHMCVNLGLLPVTGLPLPFVSYGGSSVLFYAAAAGVVLNVSAQGRKRSLYGSSRYDPTAVL